MPDQFDRLGGARSTLGMKAPARVATTANIALSGLQTIDTVALAENDRVLVKNQNDSTQNGVYLAASSGWARAVDFDGNTDIVQGTQIYVTSGAVGSAIYALTTAGVILIGVSALTFTIIAGAGGNIAGVNAALTGYLDFSEIAAPSAPEANIARVFALDDAGVTSVALKDAAGNTRSLSHFKHAGTGAAVRSQIAKMGDVVSVMDFGADPTGIADSAAAIQAAIDAVAVIGARGTVYIPSTATGGDYKINTALTWKANVNIICDPQARIFAGASMAALLQTGVGVSADRLRNVWLRGGRWDGAFLAQRGIWIKDGNGVHLSDFLIRQVGTFVDGASETESSYIRIGDPAQFTSCYEVMISNFFLGRADDAASPSLVPANNYGIYSSDGASDCHVENGVISGVETGIADELAHWKVNTVHVWNFQAGHGPFINAFYDAIGGVIIANCQVDCATFEVPFRFGSTSGHPSAMIGCQIHCNVGTDNIGQAIEVDSGTQLSAVGNVITCAAGTRFAVDFAGTLTQLTIVGHQNKNVVSPVATAGIMTVPGSIIAGHSAAIAMNESITPRAQMHSTSSGGASYSAARWSGDASSPQFSFGKSRGAIGVHTVVQSGDSLGKFRFEGSDGDQFIRGAQLEAFVDATPGNDSMPTRMSIMTSSASGTAPTERIRADSRGNVVAPFNNAVLSTAAADGFFFLPTASGGTTGAAPAATPASTFTGAVAAIYSTGSHRLFVHSGGTWRSVGLSTLTT